MAAAGIAAARSAPQPAEPPAPLPAAAPRTWPLRPAPSPAARLLPKLCGTQAVKHVREARLKTKAFIQCFVFFFPPPFLSKHKFLEMPQSSGKSSQEPIYCTWVFKQRKLDTSQGKAFLIQSFYSPSLSRSARFKQKFPGYQLLS